MFSFLRKKTVSAEGSYFPMTVDIHSHILPGIDDGSPDLETSVELVQGLMALGVRRSIATPHVISDLYRNTPDSIQAALQQLRNELAKRQIAYTVDAAAEYMMDSYFLELLQSGNRLLTLKDNILLTEFSYASRPDDPGRYSFEIQMAGYSPVLAHPERYPYFYDDYKTYHRLVDLGFMLQLNLLSLSGHYGKGAVKAAQYMLKNELISFVGTDMHHVHHLHMLSNPKIQQELRSNLGHRSWNDFMDIS